MSTKVIVRALALLGLLGILATPASANTYPGTNLCDQTSAGQCAAVDNTGAVKVAATVVQAAPTGAVTDCSGTVTNGGTAQTPIAAAPTGQKMRFILNPPSASESLWINPDATATVNGESTGSIELKAGSSYLWSQFVPTNALSIIATTTGHKFTCNYA